jgi:hypothetical protein
LSKKAILLFTCLNTFFAVNLLFGQDTLFNGRKYKIGFATGAGFQYIGQLTGSNSHSIALNTDYYYQVKFYQLQYSIAISRKKNFGIELLAQPQYNTTKYKMYPHDDTKDYLTGYEYGLNIGFLFRKNVANDLLSFYMMLSSGPHYASGTPHRQANGFMFSNNLCAGIDVRTYKSLYLDIRPGIRHISNAKFRIPNAGLNDITLTEGFFVAF